MAKFKALFKLAAKGGPVLVAAAVKYGPQIRQLAKDNPEVVEKIKSRILRTDAAREKAIHQKGAGALQERVDVLREQITYLFASANTSEVARQASEWRKELDAIERGIPVLDAMSFNTRRKERKKLNERLDHLSSHILAATLVDDIEDAEIVDEDEDK